jgi:hypothetical protein
MKRYLVVDHYYDTYMIDEIKKEHLIHCKEGAIEHIFDLKEGLFFDPKTNIWEKIEQR